MGNPANKIVSTTIGEGNDKKSVTTATVGGVSYEFRGSVTGSPPILSGITSALWATGNLFGTVILDIIALIFIWIAFMAGKWVSKAAGKAIEPFEQMWKKIWSLGASLPKYAPIPGIGVSMTGMDRLAGDVKSNFESASITKAQESRLGQMVNASKYANGDTQTKASELNKDSHEDKFKEAIHLMKRDEWQSRNTDAQKVQLLNSLLGMEENKRKDMIDRLDITNKKELKDQMKEMFDKKETYKEHDQKLEKAKWYIWSGTSSSSGNGATGTTPASANNSGSWKMVINGVTLNYSWVQLNDSPEKVGWIIADYLNSAKATMTKPTKEQIDKLMDELWVNSLKKEETIKALNKKLASDFKEEPKK